MDYSLNDAAALLGVAPATLRVWSAQFAPLLNDSARADVVQPRFVEADIALLGQVQKLLKSGRTYNQRLREFVNHQSTAQLDDPVALTQGSQTPYSSRAHGITPTDITTRGLAELACGEALPKPTAQPQDTAARDQPTAMTIDEVAAAPDRQPHAVQHEREQPPDPASQPRKRNTTPPRHTQPWKGRSWQFSIGRLLIIPLMSCLAMLAAISIVWLKTPHALGNVGGVSAAPSAAPSSPTSRPAQAALPTPLTPATPTAAPATPAVVLTTVSFSSSDILQQVVVAEAKLQTGQIETTIDYANGEHSSAHIRFDRGAKLRIQSTTTYTSSNSVRTSEQILIGEQAWQRQPDGRWVILAEGKGLWEQLQAFLPHAASAASSSLDEDSGARSTTLHWYDAGGDADVSLEIDPVSGVPRELHRVTRGSGMMLTVFYRGWNTPIEIAPPASD